MDGGCKGKGRTVGGIIKWTLLADGWMASLAVSNLYSLRGRLSQTPEHGFKRKSIKASSVVSRNLCHSNFHPLPFYQDSRRLLRSETTFER